MPEAVITVHALGKKYSLLHQRGHNNSLREALTERIGALFHPFRQEKDISEKGTAPPDREDFWALRNLSFEIRRGEVVGIIGRNGAGKSTLLKILSRITEPTTGQVRIRGRIASLLEVGTGFHPELTGRENIFLNGAILGMGHGEIRSKFDEIVAFAEVEQFLDTPVKRYSSGMYVRLAFAVAAHLEPEILVVDEVLAVGDVEFQKKCLGKMQDVASEQGRTVLFVSHNMHAVKRLCTRAIYLKEGQVCLDGEAQSVVAAYLTDGANSTKNQVSLVEYADRSGDRSALITAGAIYSKEGIPAETFSVGDTIIVEFKVRYAVPAMNFSHCVEILNSDGIPIYHLWDIDSRHEPLNAAPERVVRAVIRDVNLFPDRYFINLWVGDTSGTRADRVMNCLSFSLEHANASIKRQLSKTRGLVYRTADWSYLEREEQPAVSAEPLTEAAA